VRLTLRNGEVREKRAVHTTVTAIGVAAPAAAPSWLALKISRNCMTEPLAGR
jgi:hypothetical protein